MLVIAPQNLSKFWGLFIMKLTDKNKIEMYRLNKEGYWQCQDFCVNIT